MSFSSLKDLVIRNNIFYNQLIKDNNAIKLYKFLKFFYIQN